MKVGELLDMLGAMHASCEDVDPPLSDEEYRNLDIVVRGSDVQGNDFCGGLVSVEFEEDCDGATFVAIDASNDQEATK